MSREVLLRTTGDKALYLQIADFLAHEIATQHSAGDLLPSEGDMATRFGVNRHTLRRAIDVLSLRGLVHRQHGRRITITDRPIQYAINSAVQFSKNMEALGVDWSSEVVAFDFVEAPEDVNNAMHNEAGDMVYMQTLRCIDDIPVCITTHYMARQYRKPLESYEGGSLHDFLKSSCGLKLQRQSCSISVALMDAEAAMYLQLPLGAPLLCVDSININCESGEPVELSRSLFRGDLVKLDVKMEK